MKYTGLNYYQNSNNWWVVMATRNKKQYCLGAFKTSAEAREYCLIKCCKK